MTIKLCITIFGLIWFQAVFGLNVERNLTLRILATSSSKRTVLVNKGEEDGLKLGDQAKFYNQKGQVFAHATVRKLSPGRSLWSVFRILSTVPIHKGNVIRLEGTPPVKLTEDSTKRILGESTVSSGKLEKIPVVQLEKKSKITKSRYLLNIPKYKNYHTLNDVGAEKRDPNIDWSKLDLDEFNYSYRLKINKQKTKVDYTSLNNHSYTSKELQKRRKQFSHLDDSKIIVPNSKEVESKYSSLEDFSYY